MAISSKGNREFQTKYVKKVSRYDTGNYCELFETNRLSDKRNVGVRAIVIRAFPNKTI